MDPAQSEWDFVTIFKSHPFIPISLVFSLGALAFGAISLTRVPLERNTPTTLGIEEEASLTIAVDVEGEVARPGLIEIEVGTGKDIRVAEVLEAAGGLLPSADLEYVQRNLNLASLVTDGMKLYVPKKGLQSTGQEDKSVKATINVNTASVSLLTTLKGVGESRANVIITGRPYTSLEELKTKAKLPSSVIESIKDEISF